MLWEFGSIHALDHGLKSQGDDCTGSELGHGFKALASYDSVGENVAGIWYFGPISHGIQFIPNGGNET